MYKWKENNKNNKEIKIKNISKNTQITIKVLKC